jgi:hypothetical protein
MKFYRFITIFPVGSELRQKRHSCDMNGVFF